MTQDFENPKTSPDLAQKFAQLFAKLPDELLLQHAKTEDQKEEFLDHRLECTLIGNCLNARLSGEDDPIQDWKNCKDKQIRIFYELIWGTVAYYETLWAIVQLSFPDLKQHLSQVTSPFSFQKAWDLFAEIVCIDENGDYIQYLQSEYIYYDLTSDNKFFALAAKERRTNLINAGQLTEEEQDKLEARRQKQQHKFRNGLKELVLSFCTEFTCGKGKNTALATQLKQHRQIEAKVFDILTKLYSDAGKRRNDCEIRTEHWIDGIRYARPDNRRRKSRNS